MVFRIALGLLMSSLLVLPVLARDDLPEDDVLLKALTDEMKRSMTLQLADLATVVKDWCQPKISDALVFNKTTVLTSVQTKAFNLLGLRI